MTEKEFAEIIARALMMILRAMNRRYGLRMWILTRSERRQLNGCLVDDQREILMKYFHDL